MRQFKKSNYDFADIKKITSILNAFKILKINKILLHLILDLKTL